jgi:hypothetical protein
MRRRRFFRSFRLLLFAGLLVLVFAPEWPIFDDESYKLRTIVSGYEFDFLEWEADTILLKGEAVLANTPRYLPEDTQKQIVLDFLTLVSEVQQLDAEINQIYIDPDVANPDTASAELQKRRAGKRATITDLQPLAEAIVQNQVGTILVEQGFGVGGYAWPPVMMHMSPLPSLMMVSPRDRIERIHSHSLKVDISTPDHERLETAVSDQLNLSALVVPIGGLGTYPAMIMETSNLNWFVEVVAHEWSHHWMSVFPIGYNYTVDVQVRSINETVASTLDKEIANLVIERYYPEFMLEPQPETPPQPAEPDPNHPPPFDFRAEMAETRVEAEKLLAAGDIEGAEQYMEARRRVFVDNGYAIRKLNQAYFAFYGAYQGEPGGASGADPIGPLVREVRSNSPSLRAFMENMASVGSFADLEAVAAELRQ